MWNNNDQTLTMCKTTKLIWNIFFESNWQFLRVDSSTSNGVPNSEGGGCHVRMGFYLHILFAEFEIILRYRSTLADKVGHIKASRCVRFEAVSLLMDASAVVDPLDRHGRSPLYYAAVGNHRDVVVTGPVLLTGALVNETTFWRVELKMISPTGRFWNLNDFQRTRMHNWNGMKSWCCDTTRELHKNQLKYVFCFDVNLINKLYKLY